MSLLKLASLHNVANFWRSTDATSSFTVVLPFEPPTAMTGKSNCFRYAAAIFPNATRTSSTASTAHDGNFTGSFFFSTTTAATPFAPISLIKSWPSNFSPLMAKNKSPAFANRESVQTELISTPAAPPKISAPQASAINFKEHGSTKLFQQKRRGHHGGNGLLA